MAHDQKYYDDFTRLRTTTGVGTEPDAHDQVLTEREACAVLCEQMAQTSQFADQTAALLNAARMIRQRSGI